MLGHSATKKKKSYAKMQADTSNLLRRRGDGIREAQFEDAGRNKKKKEHFSTYLRLKLKMTQLRLVLRQVPRRVEHTCSCTVTEVTQH